MLSKLLLKAHYQEKILYFESTNLSSKYCIKNSVELEKSRSVFNAMLLYFEHYSALAEVLHFLSKVPKLLCLFLTSVSQSNAIAVIIFQGYRKYISYKKASKNSNPPQLLFYVFQHAFPFTVYSKTFVIQELPMLKHFCRMFSL